MWRVGNGSSCTAGIDLPRLQRCWCSPGEETKLPLHQHLPPARETAVPIEGEGDVGRRTGSLPPSHQAEEEEEEVMEGARCSKPSTWACLLLSG